MSYQPTLNPQPIIDNDPSLVGTITTADLVVPVPAGDGTGVTGTPTANSYLVLDLLGGHSAWAIELSGTWTGTMNFEGSMSSTDGINGNWYPLLGRQTGTGINTNLTGSTTVNGLYRGNIGGIRYLRVRSRGTAQTGTTTVNIRAGGVGTVFLNAGLPAGYDIIGQVSTTGEYLATFRGRAATFRTLGRAGTTARRLMSIWNPVGSGKVIHMNQVSLDLSQTAIMAVTVIPPVIRVYRVTAAPANGTLLTKVAKDTALTSVAGIEVRGDSSADGTNSASALTATTTLGSAITEEYAARLITAAGYEPFDREEFLVGYDVMARPGEGFVLSLDVTLATQDPATSNWIVGMDWYEAAT